MTLLPPTPSPGARRRHLAPSEPFAALSKLPPPTSPETGTACGAGGAPSASPLRRPAALVVGSTAVLAIAATVSLHLLFSLAVIQRHGDIRSSAAANEAGRGVRLQEGQRNQQLRPPAALLSADELNSKQQQQQQQQQQLLLQQERRQQVQGLPSESEEATESEAAAGKDRDTSPPSGDDFHVVFSTDCSDYMEWQSYVFFHRVMVVRQPGIVTRIASGCTPRQQLDVQTNFDDRIATMTSELPGTRFRIHFTPDFSRVKGEATKPYMYFNKPFGVRHWMENALNYTLGLDNKSPNTTAHDPVPNRHDRTIVVLVDSDELLLRPFDTNDFSDLRWVPKQAGGQLKESQSSPPPRWTRVEPGRPIGQLYAYRLQWKHKINMTLLVGPDGPKSPVDEMSDDEALEGYVVGPPLLATAKDMYRIVAQWTRFVPLVHDQYPHLLAEMFAYSLASAHLRLSHQTSVSLMMSDVTSAPYGEDWSYVDALDESELCGHDSLTPRSPGGPLPPHILHYCQDYGIGYWYFSKYDVPNKFLTCEHPLFRIPPPDHVATLLRSNVTHYVSKDGAKNVTFPGRYWMKRNAFAACTVLRHVNAAAAYYKSKHCSSNQSNVNETFTHHPANLLPPLQ